MSAPVLMVETESWSQSPCHADLPVGTQLADKFLGIGPAYGSLEGSIRVRFTAGWFGEDELAGSGTFSGVDEADQAILSDWLSGAVSRGIDSAEDLAARGWNVPGAAAIIGVFRSGESQAAWLIVRDASGWAMARCADGFVSDVTTSLPDILALIDAETRT